MERQPETVAHALASVGLFDRPDGEVVLMSLTGREVKHHRLGQVGDACPGDVESLYVASGLFRPGTVRRNVGRTADNVARVVWLPFDADLVALFEGVREEVKQQLWSADQAEIDDLITVQRDHVEAAFATCNWPIHWLDYTGYGLCAYVYVDEDDQAQVADAQAIHGEAVDRLNQAAGFPLFDTQVVDAGPRVTRVPGSLNRKGATPRLVRTPVTRPASRSIPVTSVYGWISTPARSAPRA